MTTLMKPIQACEKFFQSGKIQAMTFNLPSFSIDEKSFKFFALDTVEEKFRQAERLDGNYEPNAIAALTSSQHPRYNQEAIDITKKAFTAALSTLSQNKLSELSNDGKYIALSTTSEQLEHIHNKSKFAATLLMIKESFPDSPYYTRIMDTLSTHYDKDLTQELKGMIAKPAMDVIQHIYNIDSKFSMEKFPKQTQKIVELEKPIYFNNQKLA